MYKWAWPKVGGSYQTLSGSPGTSPAESATRRSADQRSEIEDRARGEGEEEAAGGGAVSRSFRGYGSST